MMRIVIDLQGWQAENRKRGIGRYSLSLALAIAKNRGEHEIVLALSGRFPETIEPIRTAFQDLLPQQNIRVWHAPGPLNQIDSANDWRRQSAELTREAFLASLDPSVVLVTSLFEGLVDDAVTSIGALSQSVPTAVVLYDLIPLINRSPYLDNPVVERWYENKLAHLRRADLALAISESSRREAIKYLGFASDGVVTISTAADEQFRIREIDQQQALALRRKYSLERPYVMYTGGIDHRKNIEGLIRAYARLPVALRNEHQLAVVCSIQPQDRLRLESLAKSHGLGSHDLVLTGFVPEDDLIALYRLCKIFVFPSWHEGFGLPALEAMACGSAVIGANTSSLPEVIGRDDALFDPFSDASIVRKLEQVLTDDVFRQDLERHSREQARNFSWDKSSALALRALETFVARRDAVNISRHHLPRRPRLAYLSPLPPERSGISDYGAELLPELARHYDIDVVVAQGEVTTPWVHANCHIRTVDWFRAHASEFDRVLYHFGNSNFHQHMFALLEDIPGVVVLHDFFLSGIVAHMEWHGNETDLWTRELYVGHGYRAVRHRFHAPDMAEAVWHYPCNLRVLQNAQGIIVHSDCARRLGRQWYGEEAGKDWALVPLLKVPNFFADSDRERARAALNFSDKDFVVCSFGLLGPSKLNHRLLNAWLASSLAENEHCKLVFVGENAQDEYGAALSKAISASKCGARISITGWADSSLFRQYLTAADVGVQLRTLSRGETSAAVLDCMNHGLATVVNANGSMADIAEDGVWKLPDEFTDEQLINALETLWRDLNRRQGLGNRASEIIRTQHGPRACADQYFAAIEDFHCKAASNVRALTRTIARLEGTPIHSDEWLALADSIDRSVVPPLAQRQLLVDISELVQRDAKSGIQRVVRSILNEWLLHPPEGYRVEPVYATGDRLGYRYARQFVLRFLQCPVGSLEDEPVSYRGGDVFLGLDLQPEIVPAQRDVYRSMRRQGVLVQFVVYDLLLLQFSHYFPNGGRQMLENWLPVVAESDGAICISKAVSDDLASWLKKHDAPRGRPFRLNWFHLGADIKRSAPTMGLPADAAVALDHMRARPAFLMVGTVEPRKGHAQTLTAFELLWRDGVDVNLIVVGKQGWMVEPLVEKLRSHSESGKRLFWLEGVSDEYLEKVYAASTCLMAASEGEGFGLPLIEAAQHKLPIIARDIPVFREVAGEHAHYFHGAAAEDLAASVRDWLRLYDAGHHPASNDMSWLTWKESAEQLTRALLSLPLGAESAVEGVACV